MLLIPCPSLKHYKLHASLSAIFVCIHKLNERGRWNGKISCILARGGKIEILMLFSQAGIRGIRLRNCNGWCQLTYVVFDLHELIG